MTVPIGLPSLEKSATVSPNNGCFNFRLTAMFYGIAGRELSRQWHEQKIGTQLIFVAEWFAETNEKHHEKCKTVCFARVCPNICVTLIYSEFKGATSTIVATLLFRIKF